MANYKDSPFGSAVHIHVNKPDKGIPGKFDANPTFKVDLKLSGEEALAFKELIDAHAEAAFENFKQTDQFKAMKPKDQRELGVFYPYEELEDDDGNKTGEIVFDFRQNAKIKLRDGTFKDIKIGIYDATGSKGIQKLVRSGSEVRVRYATRGIKAPSQPPKFGIRLDFMAIQVKTLAQGNSGGFGAVDGYKDDGAAAGGYDEPDDGNAPDNSSGDGDY